MAPRSPSTTRRWRLLRATWSQPDRQLQPAPLRLRAEVSKAGLLETAARLSLWQIAGLDPMLKQGDLGRARLIFPASQAAIRHALAPRNWNDRASRQSIQQRSSVFGTCFGASGDFAAAAAYW